MTINQPSNHDQVLELLGYRNKSVLIVQSTLPNVQDVLLTWTTDRSPMIVLVSQGRGWLKVLFATGTTVTFMVNRPEDTSKYTLVIDSQLRG